MNAVIPFQFQGHDVRIVDQDGNPWFVASDVAKALGYEKPNNAIHQHCKLHITTLIQGSNQRGNPNITIIPESDVYRLVIRSKLPEAEKFEKWVMEDVLPSIRKNGSYQMSDTQFIATALVKATKLLEDQKPAVEFYNAVTDSKDAMSMDEVAKLLDMGMGRNRLFEFLRCEGLLMHNNVPYQRYIDQGLFRVIEQHWTDRAGEVHVSVKTLVYQKGIERIRSLIEKMVN